MTALEVILGLMVLGLGGALILLYKKTNKPHQAEPISINLDTAAISNSLKDNFKRLHEDVNTIPDTVIKSLTGSLNTQKGKLGELIGYLTLKAEYDKIIPLGTIIDFMAIKFPSDKDPGKVDFIDIKTGENARLNKDQRALRLLIKDKKINFLTIKLDTSEGFADEDSSGTTS